MKLSTGRLLTTKECRRLAMIQSTDSRRAAEVIAELRAAGRSSPSRARHEATDDKTPRSAMRMHVEHSQFIRSPLWSPSYADE